VPCRAPNNATDVLCDAMTMKCRIDTCTHGTKACRCSNDTVTPCFDGLICDETTHRCRDCERGDVGCACTSTGSCKGANSVCVDGACFDTCSLKPAAQKSVSTDNSTNWQYSVFADRSVCAFGCAFRCCAPGTKGCLCKFGRVCDAPYACNTFELCDERSAVESDPCYIACKAKRAECEYGVKSCGCTAAGVSVVCYAKPLETRAPDTFITAVAAPSTSLHAIAGVVVVLSTLLL
jgi:hypothetical protein